MKQNQDAVKLPLQVKNVTYDSNLKSLAYKTVTEYNQHTVSKDTSGNNLPLKWF